MFDGTHHGTHNETHHGTHHGTHNGAHNGTYDDHKTLKSHQKEDRNLYTQNV